tara:strand:- start:228 stop:716 length:489 start_codon:yes stop_codon:yes gene_type:complete
MLIYLIIFFIILYIYKNSNTNKFEFFSTDNMRFIPCSDDYKLEYIPTNYNDNTFISKLFKKPINNMFDFPNCNKSNKFGKSYQGLFDRKIFARNNLELKRNDKYNFHKDLLLPNEIVQYRSIHDLETKIIPDYNKEDLSKYLKNKKIKDHTGIKNKYNLFKN